MGTRGVHFYSDSECKFMPWNKVIEFVNQLPQSSSEDFAEKLISSLANYDPRWEFLAISQTGDNVSIELYSKQS